MTLIDQLSQIDRATLLDNEEIIAGILTELIPTADLSEHSVLRSLIVRPAAAFHAQNQTEISSLINAFSLGALAGGTLTSSQIDAVLANYRVTRKQGSPATGTVKIYLETPRFLAITQSVVFTGSNGVTYSPTTPVNVVTTSSLVSGDSDILLVEETDGRYSASLSITATENGETGNISKGATFTVGSDLPSVVSAVASSDFSGGSDDETDEALALRAETSIATRSLASRASIAAVVSDVLPAVVDVAVIGSGDAEMQRGRSNVFGVPGGHVDVFVRSAARPAVETVLATAVVTDKSQGLHDVFLERSLSPGWYRVRDVRRIPESGISGMSLTVLSTTRSYDTSLPDGADLAPDLDAVTAAFTRYQTATVSFRDTRTTSSSLENGDTFEVEVDLEGMPALDTVNDYLLDRDRRHPAADYVVRAPIPCFVSLSLTVGIRPGTASPDVSTIQTAAADVVNAVSMEAESLRVAEVIAAVQAVLPSGSRIVHPVVLGGTITYPDGSEVTVTGPGDLVPDSVPELMATPRTTAFYLNPDDVVVTLAAG